MKSCAYCGKENDDTASVPRHGDAIEHMEVFMPNSLLSVRRARWPLFKSILLSVVVVVITGCAAHRQYRTQLEPWNAALRPTNGVANAIEETPHYVMGVVELDDQGWLWQRQQMEAVLTKLRNEDQKHGLLIVVFIHGWQHNATFDDSYVRMLRTVLSELHQVEQTNSVRQQRAPRRIAGVYVGWRGLSAKAAGLKQLTFWERKNSAHEVGRGGVTELLVRLEELRDVSNVLHAGESKPTRLVVVGHSFGGAVVYSALAPLLMERLTRLVDDKGNAHQARGFGDLVVLANPAFEAARYHVLRDIADHRSFQTNQPLSLAIFTSKGDDATKKAFPLGRFFSTFFEKHRDSEQKHANRSAVGHYAPLITHDLVPVGTEHVPKAAQENPSVRSTNYAGGETIQDSAQQVAVLQEQLRARNVSPPPSEERTTFKFSGAELKPRPG